MSPPDLSSTPRTALRRHHERARTDRDDLYAVPGLRPARARTAGESSPQRTHLGSFG